jgi:hypothetical protein
MSPLPALRPLPVWKHLVLLTVALLLSATAFAASSAFDVLKDGAVATTTPGLTAGLPSSSAPASQGCETAGQAPDLLGTQLAMRPVSPMCDYLAKCCAGGRGDCCSGYLARCQ